MQNLDAESDESLDVLQNVFSNLGSYCQTIRLARGARKLGDIEYALRLENVADQIYDNSKTNSSGEYYVHDQNPHRQRRLPSLPR